MLLAVVFIIAFAMAAMAYSATDVSGPVAAAVVSTDEALLALECGPAGGDGDEDTCTVNGGRVFLSFGITPLPNTPKPVRVATASLAKVINRGDQRIEITLKDNHDRTIVKYSDIANGVNDPKDEDWEYHPTKPHCINYRYYVGSREYGPFEACLENLEPPPEDPTEPGSGFPPGSTYKFEKLVRVTNNSLDTIQIRVAETLAAASGLEVSVLIDAATRGSGESAWLTFIFVVPEEWTPPDGYEQDGYVFNGNVVVSADAVP